MAVWAKARRKRNARAIVWLPGVPQSPGGPVFGPTHHPQHSPRVTCWSRTDLTLGVFPGTVPGNLHAFAGQQQSRQVANLMALHQFGVAPQSGPPGTQPPTR
mmetsp:Transcript_33882/g.73022  ORF Transcript_33882/g.73022 Transcript_33882/m.73022 type:complete len:102 (+) Transcript_33882:884-1189(+)